MFEAWPIESSTIRRCGLVEIGVALLEECITLQVGLEAQAMPSDTDS